MKQIRQPNWGQNFKSWLEIRAVLHYLRLTSRVNACLIQFNFWWFLIKFKNSNRKYAVTCYGPTTEFPVSRCKCVTPKRFYCLYNRTSPYSRGGDLQNKVFSLKARGRPVRDTQADTLGEAQAWFWHTVWPNQQWWAIACAGSICWHTQAAPGRQEAPQEQAWLIYTALRCAVETACSKIWARSLPQGIPASLNTYNCLTMPKYLWDFNF